MILPEAQEREFWQQLQAYEETKVAYVTNAERFGFERGIQEGELTLIVRLITPEQEIQTWALSLSQLEDLGEALLDFTQPSDLDHWLQSRY
jgi:hypothetical protein